jgi:hypothetical protein
MNNGLTGIIPTKLKELTKLQDLYLSGTALVIPLRGVIESYYHGSYDFVEDTHQHDALELLASRQPNLVPVPDVSFHDSKYLLLQRYVLMVLYLATTGKEWIDDKWLVDQAGLTTCNWSGVTCSDGSSIDILERTYKTVKTESAICDMISSLTSALFSKSDR